jgi:Tfp pilus assembly protein PilO
MNSPRTFFLLLVALLVLCFGLAAHLQPQFNHGAAAASVG